jgi:hypothetical protein
MKASVSNLLMGSQVSDIVAAHVLLMSTQGLIKALEKLKAQFNVTTVELDILMK